MLFYPEKVARQLDHIVREGKRKKLSGVEVGKALLELEPTFGQGSLLMGMALEHDGDLEHAEEAYWKALALCPCRPECYLHLANLRLGTEAGPDDPVATRANAIAFWKISMAEKVRRDIVDLMRDTVKAVGSPTDPYTYGMLAVALEQECILFEPFEDDERMVRYKVLNDLQRDAMGPVEPAILRRVLDEPEELAGLLHAALREWANTEPKYRTLRPSALQIFIAILGEIGGPEHIADLLELANDSNDATFRHVHWALQRLGKRHPAAALQTIRAAAPGAESGMLCALAEQLNLLPPIEGVVPALAALLEEFPRIAAENDAAFLLAMVTDSMAERDAVDEAHALLSRYRSQLSGKARKWLNETVEGDEEFIPKLIEEDIAGFTIQDVCCELALLDEEDEEEFGEEGEWEDDEDEEFELQPVFTPRAGRNDPCWCGSGKKYKKCHLRQDEEEHLSGKAPAGPSAGDPLPIRILKGMDRWHSKADMARSKEMFFGSSSADDEHDPADLSAMAQFMMHDFRDAATGMTLIEHYLKDNGSRLPAKERAEVESLRDSRFGLYETYGVDKGRGVHMRDVFDGETFFVQNVTSSYRAERGDCALLRIQFLEGRYLLAGDGTAIAGEFLDEMREFVKKESRSAGQGEAEFVRGNHHLLRRHYADLYEIVDEGDDDVSENCTANYEVLDLPALLATLRSLDDIYEEESKDSTAYFGWLGEGEKERDINATIEVSSRGLSLVTTSGEYLKLGRRMLEENAGGMLKFLDQKID